MANPPSGSATAVVCAVIVVVISLIVRKLMSAAACRKAHRLASQKALHGLHKKPAVQQRQQEPQDISPPEKQLNAALDVSEKQSEQLQMEHYQTKLVASSVLLRAKVSSADAGLEQPQGQQHKRQRCDTSPQLRLHTRQQRQQLIEVRNMLQAATDAAASAAQEQQKLDNETQLAHEVQVWQARAAAAERRAREAEVEVQRVLAQVSLLERELSTSGLEHLDSLELEATPLPVDADMPSSPEPIDAIVPSMSPQ